jgi:hypothetical protein
MPVNDLKKRCRALLRGTLKHAHTAALAGALVPLGAVTAEAAVLQPVIQSSFAASGGTFTYSYTLHNNLSFSGGVITNFMLPLLFQGNYVQNVVAPAGWSGTIETAAAAGWSYLTSNDSSLIGDPLKYGPDPQQFETPANVVLFQANPGPGLGEGSSLSGFSFTSTLGAQTTPATAFDTNGGTLVVDPWNPTPEPSTFVLIAMAGGLLATFGGWRRR